MAFISHGGEWRVPGIPDLGWLLEVGDPILGTGTIDVCLCSGRASA